MDIQEQLFFRDGRLRDHRKEEQKESESLGERLVIPVCETKLVESKRSKGTQEKKHSHS